MRRLLLVGLLLLISTVAWSRAPQHQSGLGSASSPFDFGRQSFKLFPDVDRKITFSLKTSWIPGENHQGMLRYIVVASPEILRSYHPDTPEFVEKLMRRTHECVIRLELYDSDQFPLRSVPIPFSFGVNDNAAIVSLYANDATQMDLDEYRSLIGNGEKRGTWVVSWLCDPLGPREP